MLIAGAGGHAIEILNILPDQKIDQIYFFDNVSPEEKLIFNRFMVLNTEKQVENLFQSNPGFCLGVGSAKSRKILYNLLFGLGGQIETIIASTALISQFNVVLGLGLNVMHHVIMHPETKIGDGTLINSKSEIHHNVVIGEFCEIGPGAQILGKVAVGNECKIGSGAILLPGIQIGDGVVIGAGAVVTRNVQSGSKIKGIPAK